MEPTPEKPFGPRKQARPEQAAEFNWEALVYYRPLRRVRQHLERNIDRPFSVTEAARIAGLNVTYFSSYFKARVGRRFTEWQHHVRVERAKQWMRQADYPIAEIARLVGFRDLRTFERAFKRWTSKTPSAFKQCVRPAGR